MNWVRGGIWQAERRYGPDQDFTMPGDLGWYARLQPFAPGADRGELIAPVFSPAPALALHEWWAEVGTPAGLKPYEVSPTVANQILAEYQQVAARYPLAPFRRAPLRADDALCSLLERWGPLELVVAVTPLYLSNEEARRVPLRDFHGQVCELAHLSAAVAESAGDRNQLSLELRDASQQALQDVRVYPRFGPEEVSFDVEPLSLRAALWRHILSRWGRSPYRLCKLCNVRFEVRYGPGKPPLYCEQHRNSRSHKRAERLAPPRPSEED